MVTGNSGFLGAAVGQSLLDAGAVVHGTGHTRVATACTVPHQLSLPDGARGVLESVAPSVVFHVAAPVNPDLSSGAKTSFRDGIVAGTESVVDVCRDIGARLVHVGTCAEYGAIPAPYREDQPCVPGGEYGRLKYAASQLVLKATGLDWRVVRPFRAIGPGDEVSVVAAAARAALRAEVFEMTDGTQVREWNHVQAVAQGIVAAGAHPDAKHQVINVGGGPRMSVRNVVERIFVLADADLGLMRPGARERRPHEVDALYGDHMRSRSLWGEVEQPSLDETLQAVLSWQDARMGGAA